MRSRIPRCNISVPTSGWRAGEYIDSTRVTPCRQPMAQPSARERSYHPPGPIFSVTPWSCFLIKRQPSRATSVEFKFVSNCGFVPRIQSSQPSPRYIYLHELSTDEHVEDEHVKHVGKPGIMQGVMVQGTFVRGKRLDNESKPKLNYACMGRERTGKPM